jgi:2-oxoglutarate ferredoxin oxidoreductase subunit alpha
MEPVELPPKKPITSVDQISREKPWAITGTAQHEGRNVIYSLRMQPDVLEKHVEHLFEKYARAEQELVRYNTVGLEDAEVVFVAFGTMSRLCVEAIEMLAERGVKAGMIRPISLWPFPEKAFDEIGSKTRLVISAELSMGQMIQDVKVAAKNRWPVELIHRTGGIVPSSIEIADKTIELLKEVQG